MSIAAIQKGKNCHFCHEIPKKEMICGKCKQAIYCGVDCQRKDWPAHKLVCQQKVETASGPLPQAAAANGKAASSDLIAQKLSNILSLPTNREIRKALAGLNSFEIDALAKATQYHTKVIRLVTDGGYFSSTDPLAGKLYPPTADNDFNRCEEIIVTLFKACYDSSDLKDRTAVINQFLPPLIQGKNRNLSTQILRTIPDSDWKKGIFPFNRCFLLAARQVMFTDGKFLSLCIEKMGDLQFKSMPSKLSVNHPLGVLLHHLNREDIAAAMLKKMPMALLRTLKYEAPEKESLVDIVCTTSVFPNCFAVLTDRILFSNDPQDQFLKEAIFSHVKTSCQANPQRFVETIGLMVLAKKRGFSTPAQFGAELLTKSAQGQNVFDWAIKTNSQAVAEALWEIADDPTKQAWQQKYQQAGQMRLRMIKCLGSTTLALSEEETRISKKMIEIESSPLVKRWSLISKFTESEIDLLISTYPFYLGGIGNAVSFQGSKEQGFLPPEIQDREQGEEVVSKIFQKLYAMSKDKGLQFFDQILHGHNLTCARKLLSLIPQSDWGSNFLPRHVFQVAVEEKDFPFVEEILDRMTPEYLAALPQDLNPIDGRDHPLIALFKRSDSLSAKWIQKLPTYKLRELFYFVSEEEDGCLIDLIYHHQLPKTLASLIDKIMLSPDVEDVGFKSLLVDEINMRNHNFRCSQRMRISDLETRDQEIILPLSNEDAVILFEKCVLAKSRNVPLPAEINAQFFKTFEIRDSFPLLADTLQPSDNRIGKALDHFVRKGDRELAHAFLSVIDPTDRAKYLKPYEEEPKRSQLLKLLGGSFLPQTEPVNLAVRLSNRSITGKLSVKPKPKPFVFDPWPTRKK